MQRELWCTIRTCEFEFFLIFFFQAEDGIRDYKVTGVQTCALPILFPEGFKNEVQVFVYVLSADQENDADVLGLPISSAALTMSQVPWNGPIAAVRVGRVEGAWILNPTFQQLEFSDVDMVVSGSKDSIVMVEGGALELTEAEIVKGLEVAHKGIRELLDAANELVADMRQPKMEWTKVEPPAELVARVKQLAEARVSEALNLPEKSERAQALAALKATIQEELRPEFPDNLKDVGSGLEEIEYHTMRNQVLTHGERVDGRDLDTVRPISCEVGTRSEEHTSELQSPCNLVCRLLLEKKNTRSHDQLHRLAQPYAYPDAFHPSPRLLAVAPPLAAPDPHFPCAFLPYAPVPVYSPRSYA